MLNTCDTCAHYSASVDRENRISLKCRRLQTKKPNPLFKGFVLYEGKLLDCQVERELVVPLRDRLFGKPKEPRCCGNFWTEIKKEE